MKPPPTTKATCRVCGDTRRVHPERGLPIPDTCSACRRRASRVDDDEDEDSRTELDGGEWVNVHGISRWVPNEASA